MSDPKNPESAVPNIVQDAKSDKILLPLPPIVLTPLIPQTVSLIVRQNSQKVLNPNPAEKAQQLKLKLREQYYSFIEALKLVGILNENGEAKEGIANPPSFEDVISSISEQSLMVACAYKQPTLVLDPDNSWKTSIVEGGSSIGKDTH